MNDQGILALLTSLAKERVIREKSPVRPKIENMALVYKGEQSFKDFLLLSKQGMLFEEPIADPIKAQKRIDVIALRVVADNPSDTTDFELRHLIKDRIAGRFVYNAGMVGQALDAAQRQRKRL